MSENRNVSENKEIGSIENIAALQGGNAAGGSKAGAAGGAAGWDRTAGLNLAAGNETGEASGGVWLEENNSSELQLPPRLHLVAGAAETEETGRMKKQFGFFGGATFLYACFYVLCMFRNPSGVTSPFFAAGSLLYFGLALSKLGISWKKGSIFYMTGILLLGVSTFCTDDGRIIFMNKAGSVLLLLSLLLHQFYDTASWKLGNYLGGLCHVFFYSFGKLARPFQDGNQYRKSLGKSRLGKLFFIAVGIGVAAPLFLIVFLLLASADAVFRDMSRSLFADINWGNGVLAAWMAALAFFASYCLLACLCEKKFSPETEDHKKGEPLLALTITGVLTALYLVFCAIQILYLFIGGMQLPQGYTYAQYAREGFFQLLAVSLINLILVLAVLEYFRESRALKAVLTVMSGCTFIMIVSSAMRMVIYIRYYYLTFLRILVLWALAVLFLLFLGVVASIFRGRFPLFRYSCVVVTCCYLALSFGHPDYWIARVNVGNIKEAAQESGQLQEDGGLRDGDAFFASEGYQDYGYLSRLSADAAPILVPFLAAEGEGQGQDTVIPSYIYRLRETCEQGNLLRFNVSRFIGAEKLKKYWQ